MSRTYRVLIIVSLAALITGCSGSAGATGTAPPPPASPSATNEAAFDQQFIDMMVPHHQSAIEMATIAQGRAEREEIKSIAAEIIAAQEGEIAQLRAWRTEWFGSDATPPMNAVPVLPGMEMGGHDMGGTGGTMDMTADIEELRTAEPFDKAFIEKMIPHHESAIAAAKLAEEQADRSEIRELAGEIIEAQEQEIARLKEWLEAWY